MNNTETTTHLSKYALKQKRLREEEKGDLMMKKRLIIKAMSENVSITSSLCKKMAHRKRQLIIMYCTVADKVSFRVFLRCRKKAKNMSKALKEVIIKVSNFKPPQSNDI